MMRGDALCIYQQSGCYLPHSRQTKQVHGIVWIEHRDSVGAEFRQRHFKKTSREWPALQDILGINPFALSNKIR